MVAFHWDEMHRACILLLSTLLLTLWSHFCTHLWFDVCTFYNKPPFLTCTIWSLFVVLYLYIGPGEDSCLLTTYFWIDPQPGSSSLKSRATLESKALAHTSSTDPLPLASGKSIHLYFLGGRYTTSGVSMTSHTSIPPFKVSSQEWILSPSHLRTFA